MKVNIKIPDSLNEITLFQYQNFLNIEEPNPVDVLREFCYLSDDIIKRISKVQVDAIAAQITKLFESEPQFIAKFELKGKDYGFIPKLDDISWGENADVTEYLSDWQKMHLAMSVLFRPITLQRKEKYLIEEYKGVNNDLRDMPLGVCLGAINFFFRLTNDLLSYIPNYLLKELPPEVLQTSVESGASTTKSIHSVKEILHELTLLLNYPYTNATYTLHLNKTKQSLKSTK